MKKIKLLFLAFVVTLTISFLRVNASTPLGVSVFISDMFSTAMTGYHAKSTTSRQEFTPDYVTNDRQGWVALLATGGTSTDGLWHEFNKVNGSWDTETFTTQSQRLTNTTYALKFKTTGIYIGGTGITGWWSIDL